MTTTKNSVVSLRRATHTAILRQIIVGGAAAAIIGGSILYAGEAAIGLFYLICFSAGAGLFAYHFPTLTILLWGIVGLYGRQLVGPLGSLGGIDARPTDPLLLGMAIALAIVGFVNDGRIRRILTGPCLMWTVFIAWVGFEVLRSIPTYGVVSTLGEFRGTFQNILVLPYIVVFFRTAEQQRRLLQALAALSILFIAAALFRGLSIQDLHVRRWFRFMVAQVNLALVFSMMSWYVARRTGYWRNAAGIYYTLLFAMLALVVLCGHRSVWMASAAVVCSLLVARLISIRAFFGLAIGVLAAVVTLQVITADVDLIELLRERTTAFTSFEDDSTANWRFQLWTGTIEQVKDHLLLGKGLGNYFYIPLEDGRVVTTIIHNVYLQIALQTGLVGLVLYILLVLSIFRTLWRTLRNAVDVHTHTLAAIGVVALVGGAVFYLAYSFDPFSWLLVGLGLAAASRETQSLAPGVGSARQHFVP